ncbi:App1 family protein [Granulosicoccus sp. 3-233]|uniref:App1 family protein n=1 Tax=Granulosicoccus sp. 3-233 TaxID=3417969 RepID=UPI003D339F5D
MRDSRWKTLIHRLGMRTENALGYVSGRARQKLHPEIPMHIIAYRGFGVLTDDGWRGRLQGRVLRYRQPALPSRSELWNNLRASYARFGTRELPGVSVTGQVGELMARTTTDEEGYFQLNFDTSSTGPTELTQSVELSLPGYSSVQIDGDPVISLPARDARFGVISDVDDTLLLTKATSLRDMMRLTLLESPSSRLAFAGVAEFYQALHAGRNPFFYVSSSPWNLYEFLSDFMRINQIVPGPLMLRDFGIDETKFIAGSHGDHKLQQIRTVLSLYPELPFILAGDSGQDDPSIYATIAEEFPEQVRAIYIRDVGHAWKRASIQQLISQLREREIDMLLVPDTLAAATHAHSLELLPSDSLASISRAVEASTQPS